MRAGPEGGTARYGKEQMSAFPGVPRDCGCEASGLSGSIARCGKVHNFKKGREFAIRTYSLLKKYLLFYSPIRLANFPYYYID